MPGRPERIKQARRHSGAQRSTAEHSGAEEGAEEGAEWRLYKLARWFLVGFGQCRP